jgi:hypothetical protein
VAQAFAEIPEFEEKKLADFDAESMVAKVQQAQHIVLWNLKPTTNGAYSTFLAHLPPGCGRDIGPGLVN